MDYIALSKEEQAQILIQRRKQYEAEHFNHSVNKELLEASGATDEQTVAAIKVATEAMDTLDKAHASTVVKLEQIQNGSGDET